MGQISPSPVLVEGTRQQHGRGGLLSFQPKQEKSIALSLEKAVAIFSKWKDESAQILAVCKSPFQQQRGILALGVQGKVAKVSMDANIRQKSAAVVLQMPAVTLSLSIGDCSFAYGDPKEAKLGESERADLTLSALSVFFPRNQVFIFYELLDRFS